MESHYIALTGLKLIKTLLPWPSWNSLCRWGWPQTHQDLLPLPPECSIKIMHHHACLFFLFLSGRFEVSATTPNSVYILIPGICDDVMLPDIGNIRLQIEISLIFSWPWNKEIILNVLSGPTIFRRKEERRQENWCLRTEMEDSTPLLTKNKRNVIRP